jgi:hypothetical protein
MNRCTYAVITTVLVSGLLNSLLMPSTTPDNELIKANKELTDKLTAKNEKAEQAYIEAAKALEDAKKNLSCPK